MLITGKSDRFSQKNRHAETTVCLIADELLRLFASRAQRADEMAHRVSGGSCASAIVSIHTNARVYVNRTIENAINYSIKLYEYCENVRAKRRRLFTSGAFANRFPL